MHTLRNILIFLFTVTSVTVMANIQADFQPNKTAGCPPLVVDFADVSSAGVTSWHWDFGNGNTSVLQNPSATFSKTGIYTVKLVIKKGTETDSLTKTIKVYRLPIVDLVADKPSACFYDTVYFKSKVTLGDAPIIDYGWGFGNGLAKSDDSTTWYKYKNTGTYTITLVVQDSNKCSASKIITDYVTVWPTPTAAYTAYPATSCLQSQLVTFTNQSTGVGLKYTWDLDGNGYVNTPNPTHTYYRQKYVTSLTVVDTNGCKSTATKGISVAGPSADFKASRVLICNGEKVEFTNLSNFTGTKWSWDFGDGTTSNLANPTKTYTAPGIYDVNFTISDGVCADSTKKDKYMNVREGAKLPDVRIEVDTNRACTPPLTVKFTNQTTGAIVGYQWNFGDGQISNLENPSNTYNSADVFTVSLTVMDSFGCIKTGFFPNLISTFGAKVGFEFNNGCPDMPVKFRNTSPSMVSWLWNFGDGKTNNIEHNPAHYYDSTGTYNVSLYVKDGYGCEKTVFNKVKIDSVKVDFTVNATYSPCPPFVAIFKNTTTQKDLKYRWYFGDGHTDTTANPTHIYYYPGVYTVTLIGYTTYGCTDTLIEKDLINIEGPTGVFSVTPTVGCLPLQVNFSATLSPNTKTSWSDLGDGTVLQDTTIYTHTYVEERAYHPVYVLTDHVGCTVTYPLDTVTTHTVPTLTTNDTSVCEGITANIAVVTNAPNVTWIPATYVDCDTCHSVKITAPDTMVYRVIASSTHCTAEDTIIVNVEPLPNLRDSGMINMCVGDTLPLSVGSNAASIQWSPATNISDASSFNPVCFPVISTVYTATGYNQLGCSSSAQVYITVKDKVDISVPNSASSCEFDTVQLGASILFASDLGLQYKWTPERYLDDPAIANPVAKLSSNSVDFQVIATSGHCIPDTAIIKVNVMPTPELEATGSTRTTPGSEVQLHVSSRQDLAYTWFAKDQLSCTDCRHPLLYPHTSQLVVIQGVNEYGCKATDTLTIEVVNCTAEGVYMPNTFTPNGDGVNDQFIIRTNALTSINYFRVFDKWGTLVYETDDLNKGWDGNVNGNTGGTGVYVYVLEGKCQNGTEIIKSGNVTAIR